MTIRERQKLVEETKRKGNPSKVDIGTKPTNQEPKIPNSTARIDFSVKTEAKNEKGETIIKSEPAVKFTSSHEMEVLTTAELSHKISSCLLPILKDYVGCTVMPDSYVPAIIPVPACPLNLENANDIISSRVNAQNPLANNNIVNSKSSSGFVCLLYFAEGGGINNKDDNDAIKCIERYEYILPKDNSIMSSLKFYDRAYGSKIYRLTDDAMSALGRFVEDNRMIKFVDKNGKHQTIPNWDIVRTEICEYPATGTNAFSNRVLVCVRLDALKIVEAMYGKKIKGRYYDYNISWINMTYQGAKEPTDAVGEILVGIYKLDREKLINTYNRVIPNSMSSLFTNIK